MKLFLYKLFTQCIIILGELRVKLNIDMEVRRDRTFPDPPHLFSNICCDCGLTHWVIRRDGKRFQQPHRPKDYDYTWRHGAGESSFFDVEEKVIVQTDNETLKY